MKRTQKLAEMFEIFLGLFFRQLVKQFFQPNLLPTSWAWHLGIGVHGIGPHAQTLGGLSWVSVSVQNQRLKKTRWKPNKNTWKQCCSAVFFSLTLVADCFHRILWLCDVPGAESVKRHMETGPNLRPFTSQTQQILEYNSCQTVLGLNFQVASKCKCNTNPKLNAALAKLLQDLLWDIVLVELL